MQQLFKCFKTQNIFGMLTYLFIEHVICNISTKYCQQTVVVVHLIFFFKEGQQVMWQCSLGPYRNDVTQLWQISELLLWAFLPIALDSQTASSIVLVVFENNKGRRFSLLFCQILALSLTNAFIYPIKFWIAYKMMSQLSSVAGTLS